MFESLNFRILRCHSAFNVHVMLVTKSRSKPLYSPWVSAHTVLDVVVCTTECLLT